MPAALATTTELPTLHTATLETRDATLQEIHTKLSLFAKAPTPQTAFSVAKDIHSFHAAEMALHAHREKCPQISYFSAIQIGALAGHKRAADFPNIDAAHEALRLAFVEFGEVMERGAPKMVLLGHLCGIAAIAQKAAEDCGLAPVFHDHPTTR